MSKENNATKLCKHCKTEIPAGAKVCPNCRKKQGGAGKWIAIVILAIVIFAAVSGGGDDNTSKKAETKATPTKTAEKETALETETTEAPIEYIQVAADELSDALEDNAMKAAENYQDKYIEVFGKLGNIDSNGKYIAIDSSKDFDLTNIQCYIKSDEQKEIIMEMSRGDAITIRGYCKDIGELLGYQIDIEEVVK